MILSRKTIGNKYLIFDIEMVRANKDKKFKLVIILLIIIIREAFKKKNRGFSEFGTISPRTPPPYQIVKNIMVKIGPYS